MTEAEIVNSYYYTIYKYCLIKNNGNISKAEDITQESFSILFTNLKKTNIDHPDRFLFKTAKNLCFKQYEKDKKIKYINENIIDLSVNFNEDNIITDKDIFNYKEEILNALSSKEKTIIKLFYEDNNNAKEIAKKINTSEWNIYKIKSKAEKKIKLEIIKKFQN